ncbi:hypothetical protein MTO96_006880 [Rhipicephalus appendiculatus]
MNAVGGEDPPQLGLFERRGPLREPSASDATKEEPFKRSWSFRIGCSDGGSKTKDASPDGNDKSAFLRMFRFGKDKKGGHQEPCRRRMQDAMVTKAKRKEKLSQYSSVPLDVSESPEAKHGGPSPSNAVGSEDPPQLGLFERRGPLREPSASDATTEEPFTRSWSFRIGGSDGGSKTKDASPDGNDKSAFLRMFRFGKDKKGGHQEPCRRRMQDAMVTKAKRKEKTVAMFLRAPGRQRITRSETSPGGRCRHASAHVAALSGGCSRRQRMSRRWSVAEQSHWWRGSTAAGPFRAPGISAQALGPGRG